MSPRVLAVFLWLFAACSLLTAIRMIILAGRQRDLGMLIALLAAGQFTATVLVNSAFDLWGMS